MDGPFERHLTHVHDPDAGILGQVERFTGCKAALFYQLRQPPQLAVFKCPEQRDAPEPCGAVLMEQVLAQRRRALQRKLQVTGMHEQHTYLPGVKGGTCCCTVRVVEEHLLAEKLSRQEGLLEPGLARLLELGEGALMPAPAFWVALGGSVVVATSALSLRRETLQRVATWWLLVFAVALGVWLLTRTRPQPFLEIWVFISDGIVVTLRLVITSFGFILVVSLLGGLGRISRNKIIYGIASLYVEIVRGIPLLVQLTFIWYALPQVFDVVGGALVGLSPSLAGPGQYLLDLRLDPYAAAVLGLDPETLEDREEKALAKLRHPSTPGDLTHLRGI